jgi:hypothetical protein
MEPDRRQRLEALPGWSWDPLSDQWEKGFSHLKEFSEREGHCEVPGAFKTKDGYRLSTWVKTQRRRKDTKSLDRRQRLEALPGWSWDPVSWTKWEEGFSHLKEFSEREGHCEVPRTFKTNDDYRLGAWVQSQRRRKDTKSLDRRQRLEALPGWSWDPLSDRWEKGFSHLKEFSEREGHCRVPQRFKTDDDYRLGQWVSNQRGRKGRTALDRRRRLEALPDWSWDPLSDQWEKGASLI